MTKDKKDRCNYERAASHAGGRKGYQVVDLYAVGRRRYRLYDFIKWQASYIIICRLCGREFGAAERRGSEKAGRVDENTKQRSAVSERTAVEGRVR